MKPLEELRASIARHVPQGVTSFHDGALGLKLASTREPEAPAQAVYEPVFALVVHGEKELVLGDRVFTCGEGTCIVVSVDLPLTYRISRATPAAPYMALALSISAAAVATLLLEVGNEAREPLETEVGIGVSEAPAELLDAVVRLVRLLDRPRDRDVLGPIAHKEILWRLLCSEQGHRLRQIGLADSRLAQIGRAMRFMRAHYRETLPIEALTRVSGMSVTSFHRHFRAVALMSPLQYLKTLRLQEARAQLLACADDVAGVGHAVGYTSPSQFSREYKRAYGAPPGEDARMLRSSSEATRLANQPSK